MKQVFEKAEPKTKKNRLKGYSAISVILLTAAAVVLILGLSGISSLGAITIGRLPDPADTLCGYMDSIVSGDFEKAAEYMYDCDDLGMSNPPEGEADKVLFDAVTSNYDYVIQGIDVKGVNATADVIFTCCDLNLMRDDLKAEVTEGIESGIWHGEEIESAEYLLGVVADSAEDVTEDISPYLVNSEQKIELTYYDSEWHVLFSDDFYNALLGRP